MGSLNNKLIKVVVFSHKIYVALIVDLKKGCYNKYYKS